MTFSDAVRARILELCEKKNMNVNMLSTRAGLNPSTVRSILKKRANSPKTETLYYICIGFGITLKKFFDAPIFDDIEDN